MSESPAADNLPIVGLIGHSSAGKTMFLAMLTRALGRDWQHTADAEKLGKISYLEQIRAPTDAFYFIDKTNVDAEYGSIRITAWKGPKWRMRLRLLDPAGEILKDDAQPVSTQMNNALLDDGRRQVAAELRGCSGVLVLMDPARPMNDLTRTWRQCKELLEQADNGDQQLVKRGKVSCRVAVMFTKADLLPWQRRHRLREADAWVRESMLDLYERIVGDCMTVRFFFCSAIGWVQGVPNIRAVVNPKPLDLDRLKDKVDSRRYRGDLVPDPAVVIPSGDNAGGTDPKKPSLRPMEGFSLFSDPFRFDDVEIDPARFPEDRVPLGVLTLPGRKINDQQVLRPWNLIEPIIWVAGQEDSMSAPRDSTPMVAGEGGGFESPI